MNINIIARLADIVSDFERMDFAEEMSEMIKRRGRTMSANEMIKALHSAIREIEAEEEPL
jgi:hypothetical protein